MYTMYVVNGIGILIEHVCYAGILIRRVVQ